MTRIGESPNATSRRRSSTFGTTVALPRYEGFSEPDEYQRWHGQAVPPRRSGRPPAPAMSPLRTRATLRSALVATRMSQRSLADKLEELGAGDGRALVRSWAQGGALSSKSLERLVEICPEAGLCFLHPMWRLIDPEPIGRPGLRSLLASWLTDAGACRPNFRFENESEGWAFASMRSALQSGRDVLDRRNASWRADLRGVRQAPFAGPGASALYLRADLEGFTAALAQLREAMESGWDSVATRLSVLIARMLPFAARSPMLRDDAFHFVLLVRLIVCGPRSLAPSVEINVPAVMNSLRDPDYRPDPRGAFDLECPIAEQIPVTFEEGKALPIAFLCRPRSALLDSFRVEHWTRSCKALERDGETIGGIISGYRSRVEALSQSDLGGAS